MNRAKKEVSLDVSPRKHFCFQLAVALKGKKESVRTGTQQPSILFLHGLPEGKVEIISACSAFILFVIICQLLQHTFLKHS